ncbi:inositol monophosphatase family protein [Ammoniphilus resinae]|uniref:Inositol-1-monophosphatase n=1 Tax=Ammoniphilus resinae TaxID=861532 RepID=A0ABS4GRB3_9BACL|nr:inositol monophosphatase [Ammoniphilus resinae]MBP1932667.1 myo-inositol-1(or 4)-monophosphatase [Ammoniphilus resinae]
MSNERVTQVINGDHYLPFMLELAAESGKMILPYAGNAGEATQKSKADFVTEMDLKVEKYIINQILQRYPEHRIFSEEIGVLGDSKEYEWVIDPIDGTINYSMGLPLYGISIALCYQDECIAGVIALPALAETFWAVKGKGTFMNGKKVTMRQCELSEAYVSFGDFSKEGNRQSNAHRLAAFGNLVNEVYRIRMVGSAAVTMSYIAAGRLDAAVYVKPNRYDVAAGELLVSEAGGTWMKSEGYTIYGKEHIAKELIELLPVL